MTSLTKGVSGEEAPLSKMMKSLGIIGARSRVKETRKREERNLNQGHGAGVEKRGGAGQEVRRVSPERGEVAQGAEGANQGMTGETEGRASLKREAFQGRGPNQGIRKEADQSVSQGQGQDPKSPHHAHQSGLVKVDEGAGSSPVHVQDQNLRVLKAQKHLNRGLDPHQTKRMG